MWTGYANFIYGFDVKNIYNDAQALGLRRYESF